MSRFENLTNDTTKTNKTMLQISVGNDVKQCFDTFCKVKGFSKKKVIEALILDKCTITDDEVLAFNATQEEIPVPQV